MNLNKLTKLIKRSKTRLGRGYGSGHGGHQSTFGQKGQKSRTGATVKAKFEGGQLPLVKRLPYKKGFNNNNKVVYLPINTSVINSLNAEEVTPKVLRDAGLIKNVKVPVKILFDEPLNKKVKIVGIRVSSTVKKEVK